MAALDPTSGHGVTFAYEKDPSGAQGTFTTVGGLRDDINLPLSLGVEEVTEHDQTVAEFLPDGRHIFESIDFMLNFDYSSAEHEYDNDGLGAKFIAKQKIGTRWTLPSGNAADIWIVSGFIINYSQTLPQYSGSRTVSVTFQPSGAVKIGSVTIS